MNFYQLNGEKIVGRKNNEPFIKIDIDIITYIVVDKEICRFITAIEGGCEMQFFRAA